MVTRARVRDEAMRLRRVFEGEGAQLVDTEILQPAGTLLDLYGEDIRARAYVTADPLLGEQMLRPDFTVPVVQHHIAHAAAPARYTYAGEVFRRQEDDPSRAREFIQVGLEILDGQTPEDADAEVFALFSKVLAPLNVQAATGDLGLLTAAVDGLTASPVRRAALRRHIWRPRRFRELLERFAGRRPMSPARARLICDHDDGKDVLDTGTPAVGLRSREEILARVERLSEDAEQPALSAAEVDLLDQILDMRGTAASALETARDIAVDMPAIQPAVDRLERRLSALTERGIDVGELVFEGSFGRTTLEYYDGFVFGFMASLQPHLPPLATGGRYDALTRILGQGRETPAVGGVIRPEVVLALADAERGQ